MDIHREKADQYQGLFNLICKEHGLILTINEMDEIIIEAQKVVNKNFDLADVIKSVCDSPVHRSLTMPSRDARCSKCGELW